VRDIGEPVRVTLRDRLIEVKDRAGTLDPLGRGLMASDRFGRKPVITFGLLLFAVGSLVCAQAHTIQLMLAGRMLQGSGAVAAAITALMADLTREEVRTRAMAMLGGAIATAFAFSMVASGPMRRKSTPHASTCEALCITVRCDTSL